MPRSPCLPVYERLNTNIAVDHVYNEPNAIVYRDEFNAPVALAKYTTESLASIFVLLKFY